MAEGLQYLYGAITGAGVLLAYYGIGRIKRGTKGEATERVGLLMVGGGVVLVVLSFGLMMFGR